MIWKNNLILTSSVLIIYVENDILHDIWVINVSEHWQQFVNSFEELQNVDHFCPGLWSLGNPTVVVPLEKTKEKPSSKKNLG